MIGAREPDIEKTKAIIRVVLDNGDMRPEEIAKVLKGRVTEGYARTVRAITKSVLAVQRDG
jgi:hypothetical protein